MASEEVCPALLRFETAWKFVLHALPEQSYIVRYASRPPLRGPAFSPVFQPVWKAKHNSDGPKSNQASLDRTLDPRFQNMSG